MVVKNFPSAFEALEGQSVSPPPRSRQGEERERGEKVGKATCNRANGALGT